MYNVNSLVWLVTHMVLLVFWVFIVRCKHIQTRPVGISEHDNGPLAWASYQIIKFLVAHVWTTGNISLPRLQLKIACQRFRHASWLVRHACALMLVQIAKPWWWGICSRDFHAFATHNFTYLARGPWKAAAINNTQPGGKHLEESMK